MFIQKFVERIIHSLNRPMLTQVRITRYPTTRILQEGGDRVMDHGGVCCVGGFVHFLADGSGGTT